MTEHFKPRNGQDIGEALAWALASKATLEVVSGSTKRAFGRPMNADAILDLSDMSGIALYEPEELVLTAAAGTRLDDIDAALSDGEVSGRLLNESRAQVEKITEGSATLQSSAAERLNRLNAALGKLGEPPAEGQSEVPAVAAERSRLNDAIAEISGVI
ncbi:MAG: FAD-binding protein, partial [Fimbriimonadaceae bacterium]|nr:FAD-binding protein [Alphaproteobacteria bacterium]